MSNLLKGLSSQKFSSVLNVLECVDIFKTELHFCHCRSKQTQAEAAKLKKIQKELQALDDSVSSDIGVLRRLIEQASLEYSVAW